MQFAALSVRLLSLSINICKSLLSFPSFPSLPSRQSLSSRCTASVVTWCVAVCSLQSAETTSILSLHLLDCHVPVECRLDSIAQSSIPPSHIPHSSHKQCVPPLSIQLSILDSISSLSSLLQLRIFVYSTSISPHPSSLCSFPYHPSVLPPMCFSALWSFDSSLTPLAFPSFFLNCTPNCYVFLQCGHR